MLVMGKCPKKRHAKHSRKIVPRKPPKKQGLLSITFSLLSPTGWFCALIVFLLTFVTAYYTFAFKLSITPSKSVEISNPFSALFILRNESLLWINIVNPYECFLKQVKTDNNIIFYDSTSTYIKPSIPVLESGEPTSFMPSFNINSIINNAGQIT
jgi:hypothetical protein